MHVELIDTMGSDLTVVNAARVSFDKHVDSWTDTEEALIYYLARHNHWTPFGHPQLQFRIAAPIFVARQLVKHQVGLVWNEVSRRYVQSQPEFFIPEPDEWRGRPPNTKQGSEGYVSVQQPLHAEVLKAHKAAETAYTHLLEAGVAPEQARLVLPLSLYTEWYWTGSLMAFARVCILRLAADAQRETQIIAEKLAALCEEKFPVSWKHLMRKET